MAVSTLMSSGGDYTSPITWEADTDNDLVTAAEGEELECYGFEFSGAAITVLGATVNATYYRRIYAASGAEAKTYWDTSTAFRWTTTAGSNSFDEDYLRVERIQVQTTSPTTNRNAFTLRGSQARAMGCVFRDGAAGGDTAQNRCCIVQPSAGNPNFVVNCVALGRGSNTIEGFQVTGSGAGSRGHVYNCVAVNCATGFNTGSREKVAKNCLSFGNTTADYGTTGGAWTTGTDTNASEDTTAPGANPVTSIADPFEDYAGLDLHLAVGSAMIGAGLDLSADSAFPFSTDFDGDARTTWSIGIDEGPAAGGGSLPPLRRYSANAIHLLRR